MDVSFILLRYIANHKIIPGLFNIMIDNTLKHQANKIFAADKDRYCRGQDESSELLWKDQ